MHPREQTIFALSSGRPPTAIAIVRVSGARAADALRAIAGRLPPPRVATRAMLKDSRGEGIDDAIVLWFPGPASATGEDLAEFHVHGGRAVLTALFAALSGIAQVRPAEPGEFTRRAFENGKLDLTEAERSTISFTPTPTGNANRRCGSCRACSATRRATGGSGSSPPRAGRGGNRFCRRRRCARGPAGAGA